MSERCTSSAVNLDGQVSTRRRSHTGRSAGVARHLGHPHLGAHSPHGRPLVRAVVEEQEAVESQIEIGRKATDVVGLGLPVDRSRDEIIGRQSHTWMIFEGGYGVCVVLAQPHEKHTLRFEAQTLVLECLEGIARWIVAADELVHSVVAKGAAPQRIVEIERNHLDRLGDTRLPGCGECTRKLARRCRRVADAPVEPQPRIVAQIGGNAREGILGIDQLDVSVNCWRFRPVSY